MPPRQLECWAACKTQVHLLLEFRNAPAGLLLPLYPTSYTPSCLVFVDLMRLCSLQQLAIGQTQANPHAESPTGHWPACPYLTPNQPALEAQLHPCCLLL